MKKDRQSIPKMFPWMHACKMLIDIYTGGVTIFLSFCIYLNITTKILFVFLKIFRFLFVSGG